MREDYQENLAKMFPKGFIIVYVNRDETINYHMNNPDLVEQIFIVENGLLEWIKKEKND